MVRQFSTVSIGRWSFYHGKPSEKLLLRLGLVVVR